MDTHWDMFVPEKGDIIWLNFEPVLGSEQGGRRPALVLTPFAYNQKTGHCVVCPITSKIKGYSFEVFLPENCPVAGVCLVDHLKNQNWKVRNPIKITSISEDEMSPIETMLAHLLFG